AQICTLDVSIAFETHNHPPLSGLEELSAFADYRVPQALRALGILRLDADLATDIDRAVEIPATSDSEIELRAATIQAVHRMTQAVADRGMSVPAWQIDWYLWARSHDTDVAVQHHRTRTIYY